MATSEDIAFRIKNKGEDQLISMRDLMKILDNRYGRKDEMSTLRKMVRTGIEPEL